MRSTIIAGFVNLLLLCSCTDLVAQYAFYPDRSHIVPPGSLPQFASLVSFSTSDRIKIQGLFFKHEAPNPSNKILIYFHGNAGNMYDRIEEASELFKLKTDVLLVSYRGYAQSEGSPTEQGVYLDGEAALDFAISRLGYAESRVIIYGRSIGTSVAVHVSQEKQIRNLILITPFSTGSDLASKMKLGSIGSLAGDAFDQMAIINNALCPLLVIHGTKDEVIPYDLGVKLFSKYEKTKHFVSIIGGGHNNLEYVDRRKYYDSIDMAIN